MEMIRSRLYSQSEIATIGEIGCRPAARCGHAFSYFACSRSREHGTRERPEGWTTIGIRTHAENHPPGRVAPGSAGPALRNVCRRRTARGLYRFAGGDRATAGGTVSGLQRSDLGQYSRRSSQAPGRAALALQEFSARRNRFDADLVVLARRDGRPYRAGPRERAGRGLCRRERRLVKILLESVAGVPRTIIWQRAGSISCRVLLSYRLCLMGL